MRRGPRALVERAVRVARRWMGKGLRLLPGSSRKFGPPRRIAHTGDLTRDFDPTTNSEPLAEGVHLETVRPPRTVSRSRPRGVAPPGHPGLTAGGDTPVPLSFAARIPAGRVAAEGCAVMTAGDAFLPEVSSVAGLTTDYNPVLNAFFLGDVHRVEGTILLLACTHGETYYHFLFDVLPRIDLWRNSSFADLTLDGFLVNDLSPTYVTEALQAAEIPPSRCIDLATLHHVEAQELIVTSTPQPRGLPLPEDCAFLRKILSPIADGIDTGPKDRIYITREDSPRRRVHREEEVVAFLEERGFETFAAAGVPLAHQIARFRCARVVVGGHGAGLSNLVFCEPGTKVIELFSDGYQQPMYWSICESIGLDYRYLITASRPTDDDLSARIPVDLDRLEALLDELGV